MSLILQVFYSIFSAVLLGLAIPSDFSLLGNPYLTIFALVPFYIAFTKVKKYRHAFLLGFLQTSITHLISSSWLANFKDFAALTLGASAFGTGLIGGFVFILLKLPYSSSSSKNSLNEFSIKYDFLNSRIFKIFYFSCVYVIYEWCKSVGFLGYPWAVLSATIYKWPLLMQLASVTGTYGITWILAFLNALIAESLIIFSNCESIQNKKNLWSLKTAAIFFVVIFSVTMIHGLHQYYKKRIPKKYLTTILVQPNADSWKNQSDDNIILDCERLSKEQYDKLKEQNENPDLIVWCEGVLNYHFPKSENYYKKNPREKPLTQFVKELQVPLFTGGAFDWNRENKIFFNSALMFDKDGKYRGFYAKNHLVPLAEAIPGMEYPKIRNFMQKVIGISAGWSPGNQYTLFEIPCKKNPDFIEKTRTIDITKSLLEQQKEESLETTVKISGPICYDDAFPDIMRPLFLSGAEIFVNLTNDSWSLKKSSEYQHYIVSSYRTIEYRIPLVRATNGGCTCVIDVNGKTLEMTPLFEQNATSYKVPIYERTMTTYARFGNWLVYVILILTILYVVYSILQIKKIDYIPSKREIKKSKKSKKNRKSEKSKKHKK